MLSDLHLSSPDGRWPDTTAHFRAFLDSLKHALPQIMFINGDILDNYVSENGNAIMGSLSNWEKDAQEYLSAIERLEDTSIHGSLGPGHDFTDDIPMCDAGEGLSIRPRGCFAWHGFHFVWISGKVHSFSNDPALREESFDADDLRWLDHELVGKDNVVLLFHVPLRTEATAERGKWPGNRNITIPPEDSIYSLIDKHLSRVKWIFNGHMHGVISSEYKGIPVQISTFYNQGHYCKASVHDGELNVSVHSHPPVGSQKDY